MNYSDIIGHEKIIKRLKSIVVNDKVVHAYLFRGAKSLGKMSVAKIFAKTLLCQKGGSEPCGVCPSCVKFDHANHPDMKIISKDGNSIKKAQIDEVHSTVNLMPYESTKKVYIIENADNMTVEAQNSFLKTLEEPPKHVVIIMTCVNSYSLLQTIISRTQTYTFFSIKSTQIKQALMSKYDLDESEADFITSFSNGIIGEALNECQTDKFKDLRNKIIEIVSDIIDDKGYNLFKTTEYLIENKDDIYQILDMLMIWLRDLMIIKTTRQIMPEVIINKDKIDILKRQSRKLQSKAISNVIDIVEEAKQNIKFNTNMKLNLDVMLLRLQEVLYDKCSGY